SRYPNNRIRVEYSGDTNLEGLYTLFRKYGKIVDINIVSSAAKDGPKTAIVQYQFMRSSTSAKNCLHGAEFNGARLNVIYERTLKGNIIWKWITDHPKISVPVGGFLVGGISYMIFDPIRVFSMHS